LGLNRSCSCSPRILRILGNLREFVQTGSSVICAGKRFKCGGNADLHGFCGSALINSVRHRILVSGQTQFDRRTFLHSLKMCWTLVSRRESRTSPHQWRIAILKVRQASLCRVGGSSLALKRKMQSREDQRQSAGISVDPRQPRPCKGKPPSRRCTEAGSNSRGFRKIRKIRDNNDQRSSRPMTIAHPTRAAPLAGSHGFASTNHRPPGDHPSGARQY
jgi:hypothetical protein